MARNLGNHRITAMPVLVEDGLRPFEAELYLPRRPWGAVVFAHARGGDQDFAAGLLEALNAAELAVLSPQFGDDFDEEEAFGDGESRLARLQAACRWLAGEAWTSGLAQGLFGSGTLAAPVLRLASEAPDLLQAVAIFEGLADMTEADLEEIEVPSLFIADSSDPLDAELHEAVAQMLRCESRLILLDKALMPPKAALEWYLDHFKGYYKNAPSLIQAARMPRPGLRGGHGPAEARPN